MPSNDGATVGFSGGAIISTPAVDPARGLVFVGTDHQYTQPDSVIACLQVAPDDWSAACYPPEAHFDSMLALNQDTGEPRWSFRARAPIGGRSPAVNSHASGYNRQ